MRTAGRDPTRTTAEQGAGRGGGIVRSRPRGKKAHDRPRRNKDGRPRGGSYTAGRSKARRARRGGGSYPRGGRRTAGRGGGCTRPAAAEEGRPVAGGILAEIARDWPRNEDGRGGTRIAGRDRTRPAAKQGAGRGGGVVLGRPRGKKVRDCPQRNKDGWPWGGLYKTGRGEMRTAGHVRISQAAGGSHTASRGGIRTAGGGGDPGRDRTRPTAVMQRRRHVGLTLQLAVHDGRPAGRSPATDDVSPPARSSCPRHPRRRR